MDRGATAAVVTELEKPANQPVHLIAWETTESGWVYMCDGFRTITWDGHDWIALGYFLGFSDIEETAEMQVSNVTLTLSGVDQTWISGFLQNQYIDRQVIIYKAFLDQNMALICDPFIIFEGRIDRPRIKEDPDSKGESIVAIEAADQWVDFERTSGRHTNHAEQQIHAPGDMFFEFADQARTFVWGKA